jgi:hypothetical protein
MNAYGTKFLAIALSLSLVGMGMPQIGVAALIGTHTAIELQKRDQRLVQIDSFLAREDVQAQFIALGVDPAEAQERIAALSDQELRTLEEHLNQLPAGGTSVLAVVGIVFIVLIILELVGAINIFSKA